MKLVNILKAQHCEDFEKIIKKEIQEIRPALLPLQQGLSYSSYVMEKPVNATILAVKDNGNSLSIKAGVFYTGIIAGCNCADDPTPMDEQNEYCELLFTICKDTAETTIKLLEG